MYVDCATGHGISLHDEDKKRLEETRRTYGYLPRQFNGQNYLEKVVLRVREHAEPDADQLKFSWYEHPPNCFLNQNFVEPGFWIEMFPFRFENIGGMNRKEYDHLWFDLDILPEEPPTYRDLFIITIDSKRWNQLQTKGSIHTRCIYDRIDIAAHWQGAPNRD